MRRLKITDNLCPYIVGSVFEILSDRINPDYDWTSSPLMPFIAMLSEICSNFYGEGQRIWPNRLRQHILRQHSQHR